MYAGLVGLLVHGLLVRRASSYFDRYTIIGFACLACGFFGMSMVLIWG